MVVVVSVCNWLGGTTLPCCLLIGTHISIVQPFHSIWLCIWDMFLESVTIWTYNEHDNYDHRFQSLQNDFYRLEPTWRTTITRKRTSTTTTIHWHQTDRTIFIFCIPFPISHSCPSTVSVVLLFLLLYLLYFI